MGANGSTGPEAVATAEKNAAILTAKAGARDPSAIPSICRISAALQYPAGELSIRRLEICQRWKACLSQISFLLEDIASSSTYCLRKGDPSFLTKFCFHMYICFLFMWCEVHYN